MPTDMGAEMRESFGDKNVRFLGYNILKHVEFNGEPVVPQILSEGFGPGGGYFDVEKLKGVDLDRLSDDENVRLTDKLGIVKFVANQLKAIDESGNIVFDRDGKNIKVLAYGKGYISVRQLDIEEIYDKNGGGLYAEKTDGELSKQIIQFEPLGINLWCESVSGLAGVVNRSFEVSGEKKPEWLKKYRELNWYAYDFDLGNLEFQKSDVLDKFTQELTEYVENRNMAEAKKQFGKF